MAKVSFVLALALIVWAGISDVALAKGGGGGQGKQCKPGMSFDDCYKRCLDRTGPDFKSMNKCEKKCSKRGCQ